MRGLWRLQELGKRTQVRIARYFAMQHIQRFTDPRNGQPHLLPSQIIISLTSYPPRFGHLRNTLISLLDQKMPADLVVLWIAESDAATLPADVRSLELAGLTIRMCDDLRSYKKLLPALALWPDAFIVTADDDIHYPRTWLARLVETAHLYPGEIIAHRAHMAHRTRGGQLAPYAQWEMATCDDCDREPDGFLFPTGAGGVLYPPAALDVRVADFALARQLCPMADDVWLFWMAELRGTSHRLARRPILHPLEWDGSQGVALFHQNWHGGHNDDQIRAMERHFGPLRRTGDALRTVQAG